MKNSELLFIFKYVKYIVELLNNFDLVWRNSVLWGCLNDFCCYKVVFFDWLVGFYFLNIIYIKRIFVYYFDIILFNNMKVYIIILIYFGCFIKYILDIKFDVVFLFLVKVRYWAVFLNGDYVLSRLL